MKNHLIGLLFAVAVACLMCLPFIVSSEECEVMPEPPRTAVQEDAILTAQTAEARVLHVTKTDGKRHEQVITEAGTNLASGPVRDANGLPILRTSYLRSNYQAFCLTGNGG